SARVVDQSPSSDDGAGTDRSTAIDVIDVIGILGGGTAWKEGQGSHCGHCGQGEHRDGSEHPAGHHHTPRSIRRRKEPILHYPP
ncbi:MAG: hypothetical protein ABGX31_04970, partial [bacterium]